MKKKPHNFGNEFWKARTTHGRKKKFTKATLLKGCNEYFQWITDNPLIAAETVKFQGFASLTDVPKMRAMTIQGLCIFLDISDETWANYREDAGFKKVCQYADRIIYQQKFTGAAADLLNPNIIARELGLTDKKEHDLKSTDGSMTPVGINWIPSGGGEDDAQGGH
jgi:hypothetical protein